MPPGKIRGNLFPVLVFRKQIADRFRWGSPMDADILKNLTDPAILFFFLGVTIGLIRSNLEIPAPIAKFLSLYLLMALGFKGGQALAEAGTASSSSSRRNIATLSVASASTMRVAVSSCSAGRVFHIHFACQRHTNGSGCSSFITRPPDRDGTSLRISPRSRRAVLSPCCARSSIG